MGEVRKPLIAGNWKLNLTSIQGSALVLSLIEGLPADCPEVVLFPTFLTALPVAEAAKGSVVKVGVQDIGALGWGAFTGAVCPQAVIAEGLEWAIIGHSERRKYFGETDESVAEKLRIVLESGMNAIVCIGETLSEREAGETFEVLRRQLELGIMSVAGNLVPELNIAYEPVWAIGTGRTATPETAQEAHSFIRGLLRDFDDTGAAKTRLLYGGSVKPENVRGLMAMRDIDGALVGGASLNAESFLKIIRYKEI